MYSTHTTPLAAKPFFRQRRATSLVFSSLLVFFTCQFTVFGQDQSSPATKLQLSKLDLSKKTNKLLDQLKSFSDVDVESLGSRITSDESDVAEITNELRELRSFSEAERNQFVEELSSEQLREMVAFLSMLIGNEQSLLPAGWEKIESDEGSWKTTGKILSEYEGHRLSGSLLELGGDQTASLRFIGRRIAIFGSTGPYLSGAAKLRLDGDNIATEVEWDVLVADHQPLWISKTLELKEHILNIGVARGEIGIDYVAVLKDADTTAKLPNVAQRALPAAFVQAKTAPLGEPLSLETGDIDRQLEVVVDGEKKQRKYIVHLPPDARENLPVLLVLHGIDGTAASMRDWTRLNEKADSAGFIAVYLESPGMWLGGNDHSYVLNVLDEVARDYKPDKSRFYATGFSAGGFMCHSLAMLHPNRIAAIASVAGGIPLHHYPFPAKTPHSISTLDIHNRFDQVVSYSEVPTDFWCKFHGIDAEPATVATPNANRKRRSWKGNGIEVSELVYDHEYGNGHGWPTKAQEGFDANDVIWEFVKSYRRN